MSSRWIMLWHLWLRWWRVRFGDMRFRNLSVHRFFRFSDRMLWWCWLLNIGRPFWRTARLHGRNLRTHLLLFQWWLRRVVKLCMPGYPWVHGRHLFENSMPRRYQVHHLGHRSRVQHDHGIWWVSLLCRKVNTHLGLPTSAVRYLHDNCVFAINNDWYRPRTEPCSIVIFTRSY